MRNIFFSILLLLVSCSSNDTDTATINVKMGKEQASKLHGRHFYLYNESNTVLDSAIIDMDGIAVFNISLNKSFQPQQVRIKYDDTFKNIGFKRPIGFKNPYIKNTLESSFYLDRGITKMGCFYNEKDSLSSFFEGNKQNIPYLKNVLLSYPGDDSINRKAIIEKDISKIKEYPYSVFLLKQLFYNKQHFLDDDLKDMLSYFDVDARKNALYKSFDEYFTISATYDKAYPATIKLQDSTGRLVPIADEHAKYHLIVFWASWCGPCRKEIPELKEVYAHYKSHGLSITSVSIDNDTKAWRKAIDTEKMPWAQVIVPGASRKLLDAHYDIKAIPKAYLFDEKKQLVEVFSGFGSRLAEKMPEIFDPGK